jgi:hypothetical protein
MPSVDDGCSGSDEMVRSLVDAELYMKQLKFQALRRCEDMRECPRKVSDLLSIAADEAPPKCLGAAYKRCLWIHQRRRIRLTACWCEPSELMSM